MIPTYEEVMQLTRTVSAELAFDEFECKGMYDLLVSLPDEATVMEIGCQYGRSSSIIAQIAKAKDFKLYFIDNYAEGTGAPEWIKMMTGIGHPFTLRCMTSERAGCFPEPAAVDLLFIDGFHETAWIDLDYVSHAWRVYPPGICCYHDFGRDTLPDIKTVTDARMTIENGWEPISVWGTLAAWRRIKRGGRGV